MKNKSIEQMISDTIDRLNQYREAHRLLEELSDISSEIKVWLNSDTGDPKQRINKLQAECLKYGEIALLYHSNPFCNPFKIEEIEQHTCESNTPGDIVATLLLDIRVQAMANEKLWRLQIKLNAADKKREATEGMD